MIEQINRSSFEQLATDSSLTFNAKINVLKSGLKVDSK